MYFDFAENRKISLPLEFGCDLFANLEDYPSSPENLSIIFLGSPDVHYTRNSAEFRVYKEGVEYNAILPWKVA